MTTCNDKTMLYYHCIKCKSYTLEFDCPVCTLTARAEKAEAERDRFRDALIETKGDYCRLCFAYMHEANDPCPVAEAERAAKAEAEKTVEG